VKAAPVERVKVAGEGRESERKMLREEREKFMAVMGCSFR